MVSIQKNNLVLANVRKEFGDTVAVDNISFEVKAGTVFGYIGPNGAGKTTSMRIMATLELPDQGDAYIDGFSAVNDPDRVRARLGFMPDYFGTQPNINVFEYLDFFARSYGLRGKDRTRALSYVLDFTHLDGLAKKPINGLSKGMKQRLCVGRAIIHNPSVLIMDEPAAGLDPRARIELRNIIRDLAETGKTVLISSHILTELAEMCDMVGIIEQGKLLEIGSIDDISARSRKSTQRAVQVRIVNSSQSLAKWLEEHDYEFGDIRVDGELLYFTHHGTQEDEVNLLKELILNEFPVAEFSSKMESLENLFLNITEGKVQ